MYAINAMGQKFQFDAKYPSGNDFYTELIDWHLRERYWGINFAAEMSKYSPGLNRENAVSRNQERLWTAITNKPEFLRRFMEIPYPAYRLSFVQSLFAWFFTEEDHLGQGIDIRNLEIMDLVEKVGILIPKDSLQNEKQAEALDILTLHNLDTLMDKAIYLSVLSCMEIFWMNKLRPQGSDDIMSLCSITHRAKCEIDEILENRDFWERYKAAIYHLFCDEIKQRYKHTGKEGEMLAKRYPLILMPADDYHAKKLLEVKACESGDRVSDACTMAYSSVQKDCYRYGMNSIIL